MTCRQCALKDCETLIASHRDLCERHFMKLPEYQRQILDRLITAEKGSHDGHRYEAELAASVHVLEGLEKRPTTTQGVRPGQPGGPGLAG